MKTTLGGAEKRRPVFIAGSLDLANTFLIVIQT